MPLNEIETHPYLQQGELNNAKKLILGSFPVYEVTNPDNDIKRRNRQNEGTIRFFYGSCDSQLWRLYQKNVDSNINLPPDGDQILDSLNIRSIAISDTILSCQRNGYSSLDSDLIKRTYNRISIQNLIENGVEKILCTSKGVLVDLEKRIICDKKNPVGSLDLLSSKDSQTEFVEALNGDVNLISHPILKVFNVNNRIIKALAIPSPGSPQRQLKRFGFNGVNWKEYSENYFKLAFNWLND